MAPTTDNKSGEHVLMASLGISLSGNGSGGGNNAMSTSSATASDVVRPLSESAAEDATGYEVVPNPDAEAVDWRELPKEAKVVAAAAAAAMDKADPDSDLDALQELLPDLKARRRSNDAEEYQSNNHNHGDNVVGEEVDVDDIINNRKQQQQQQNPKKITKRLSMESEASSTGVRNITAAAIVTRIDSMRVQGSRELDDSITPPANTTMDAVQEDEIIVPPASTNPGAGAKGAAESDDVSDDKYSGLSGNESDAPVTGEAKEVFIGDDAANKNIPKEFYNNMPSGGQSVSTATQTHEVRMPMYLPTFKPATGCTNASDFVVRCFVARLRSGITVVKHGRSRWCKSRLRVLHIHPDGCSLSWKPAEGEPTTNRRPPKLDLTQCLEVRHAWSPDPQNPMYTGTPILRQKCEAANAHKSFALIFPKRTVDITAVTADQCKVLMEGFSALCFRLQVADLAGKGGATGANAAGANKKGGNHQRMPEEDGVSTTASVTLTNSSTPRVTTTNTNKVSSS